jgi:hypothetical protein
MAVAAASFRISIEAISPGFKFCISSYSLTIPSITSNGSGWLRVARHLNRIDIFLVVTGLSTGGWQLDTIKAGVDGKKSWPLPEAFTTVQKEITISVKINFISNGTRFKKMRGW